MFKLDIKGIYANKVGTDEWHNVESSTEYLTWLAEGNTPEPADQEVPAIPTSVTMRQARLALLAAGKLEDVDLAIAAVVDPTERKAAQIEWEYAQTVERGHQWVQNLAAALSLDEAALDALFTQAAAL